MNSQKRNQLRERIRTLEGLTADERSALLGLLAESKPYGLVWEEKPEDVEERLREELPILREVPERAIISDDPDAPNHILIEGDNLEALSTLAYTHEGRIDVIYIDPPYNTGNKDFVYNDSFVDREDAFRHSKWLSFMAKRLRIAKKLLSERGVIFISIDDNEQAQLKLLCDEVFGEENHIVSFSWVNSLKEEITDDIKFAGSNLGSIKQSHEYVLAYANRDFNINLDECKDPYIVKLITNGSNVVQELVIPSGLRSLNRITKTIKGHVGGKTDCYDILTEDGMIIRDGVLTNDVVIKGPLRNPNTLQRFFAGETVIDRKGQLLVDVFIADNGMIHTKKKRAGQTLSSVLVGKGTTKNGTLVLKDMFGETPFGYAKPIELIQYLITKQESSSSTVLDFFAGSGTTLHAVMQLNSEDGGHRQCILVTNNENGICENVTYERNRRVIQGYTTPKGEARAGLSANTLRYYRTDFISRSRSLRNMRQLVRLATDMLCIKENIYTEEREFGGQATIPAAYRAFREGGRQMLVVYSEEAVEDLAELICGMDLSEPIIVYVFSPSEDVWNEQWEDVREKVRLTALPAAIYNTYRRILPRRRDTPPATEQAAQGADGKPQPAQPTLFSEEDMA